MKKRLCIKCDMHLQKLDKLLEVHIFMKERKRTNKKYSPEFKIGVIMDMREHHLSYRETVRKYWSAGQEDNYKTQIKRWERISIPFMSFLYLF